MSLFDFIENEPDQPPDQVTIQPEKKGKKKSYWQRETALQRKPKPEKLKFLKPCPVCQGCDFTHGKNGGFFCTTCQPGIDGHPVIALGHRGDPEKGLARET